MEWKEIYGKVKAIDKKVTEAISYTNNVLMYGDLVKKEERMTYDEASEWAGRELDKCREICRRQLENVDGNSEEARGWKKVLKACDEVSINMPIM